MNIINIPGFNAEATLYRTRNRYRVSGSASSASLTAQSVVPALNSEDSARCSACENKCNGSYADCVGIATATWLAGLGACAATGPFYPLCATPVTIAFSLANGLCAAKLTACHVVCNAPGDSSCCPVFCELGHCCSTGETCTSHGCCPSGRSVCGDQCCPEGYSCCGGTCCPNHCCGGTCCDAGVPCCGDSCCSIFGGGGPPPPPPESGCYLFEGGSPCGSKCCFGGLQCCGYSAEFGPDCRTTCIH